MAGRFSDEWSIGDTLSHDVRRTVTETNNLLFSTMTHSPQRCTMIGLSVGDTTTLGTLVANLGYDKLVMHKPVFIRDTMRAESEIIDLTPNRSRPGTGIVIFNHRLENERGEVVC